MEAWAEALSKCGSAMAFVINDFRGNITKIRKAYEEDKEGRNTLKKLVEAECAKGMHKKNKCGDPSGAIGLSLALPFDGYDGIQDETFELNPTTLQDFCGPGATSSSTSTSGRPTSAAATKRRRPTPVTTKFSTPYMAGLLQLRSRPHSWACLASLACTTTSRLRSRAMRPPRTRL